MMIMRLSRFVPAAAAFSLLLPFGSLSTQAQVAPAADAGGYHIWAGGLASGLKTDFGDRKLGGITGLVDVDTRRGIGIEAEGRWSDFHQFANVHVETYSIGARYHTNLGKWQPYAKGLVGFGDFNYTNNLGTGRFTVLTVGGGVDYQLKRRIYIRAADLEYQIWPQFTDNGFDSFTTSMLAVGIGVRVRVF